MKSYITGNISGLPEILNITDPIQIDRESPIFVNF